MTTSLLCSLAGGFLLTGMFASAAPAGAQSLQYPAARKSDVVDDYHGTRVPDPYRWLEDPDSPESRAWIEAQNRLTAAYLAEIPARSTIRERLTKLWNYPKYGTPFRKGRRLVSRSRIVLRAGISARYAAVSRFCASIQARLSGESGSSSQRYGSGTRVP